MRRVSTFLPALAFLTAYPLMGQQQTLFLPQVVDGGGWQTTVVLTNRTASTASASLSFRIDTAAGATQPWNPPFSEVSSTAGLRLVGGSTTYLHTLGTAVGLSQGWAVVNADTGIVAYAIFTLRVPGRQDQDGTVIASSSATRVLVPFDNSAALVTSIGVVNPLGTSQSISVNFRTANGTVSQSSLPSVPPNGHMAFSLPQQFPAIAGQSGLAEFYSTGGLSLLALRFNPTGAFTTAPVYFESGSPVISSAPPVIPPSTLTFGAGKHLIGKDIPPGRYYATPAAGCYWERLSGLGGSLGEIIANDFVSTDLAQAIVDIGASDLAFSTDADCGTWYPTARLGSQSSIPAGTWLVGAQITPGTYRANAKSGCYWERVRNFGGLTSAIIANDFVSSAGNQLVSISATDVGFSTDADCGVWTRVSGQAALSVTSNSVENPAEVKRNWLMKRSKKVRIETPRNLSMTLRHLPA
jgi:hypothetical protein